MGTASIIFTILAALAPLLVKWLSQRMTRKADPEVQHEERVAEDDRAIAAGADGLDDINRRLADYDRRLPDKPS